MIIMLPTTYPAISLLQAVTGLMRLAIGPMALTLGTMRLDTTMKSVRLMLLMTYPIISPLQAATGPMRLAIGPMEQALGIMRLAMAAPTRPIRLQTMGQGLNTIIMLLLFLSISILTKKMEKPKEMSKPQRKNLKKKTIPINI